MQAFLHFLQPFSCIWLCKHTLVYRKFLYFLSQFFRALTVALDHHNNPRSLLCLLCVYFPKCSFGFPGYLKYCHCLCYRGANGPSAFCPVVNFHKTCRNLNIFTILSDWADISQWIKYYLGVLYCKLKQETRLN